MLRSPHYANNWSFIDGCSRFEYGDLFETFLINEFFEIAEALQKKWRFSYLRTKDDVTDNSCLDMNFLYLPQLQGFYSGGIHCSQWYSTCSVQQSLEAQ